MKLARKPDNFRIPDFGFRIARRGNRRRSFIRTPHSAFRNQLAFTLAEVMAAMLFLAVVIPVAVEVLHIASLGGEVAVRKSVAARVADRVLSESLVTTNWSNGIQSGTATEGSLDMKWKLSSQAWTEDAMQLLTAEVTFSAQGKDYTVKMSTLANLQTQQ
jgi:hypothetical protein